MILKQQELDCAHARELMFDYIDEQLSAADRLRLESHLAGCAPCRDELAERRQMLEMIKLAAGDAPRELKPAVMQKIAALPQDAPEPKKWHIAPWGTVAAACAVVMIMIAGHGIAFGGSDGMVAEDAADPTMLSLQDADQDGGSEAGNTAGGTLTEAWSYSDDVIVETTSAVTMASPPSETRAETNAAAEKKQASDSVLLSVLDKLSAEQTDAGAAVLICYASDFEGLAPEGEGEVLELDFCTATRYVIDADAETIFSGYLALFDKTGAAYRTILPEDAIFERCEVLLVHEETTD